MKGNLSTNAILQVREAVEKRSAIMAGTSSQQPLVVDGNGT